MVMNYENSTANSSSGVITGEYEHFKKKITALFLWIVYLVNEYVLLSYLT